MLLEALVVIHLYRAFSPNFYKPYTTIERKPFTLFELITKIAQSSTAVDLQT